MPHVVLLGDSIFDNGAYVSPGEPDVLRQVQAALPSGWQTTLAARDGAVLADVPRQLSRLPGDATHLVLSVGGNDALSEISILNVPVQTVGGALDRLAAVVARFEERYAALLEQALRRGLPVTVCTIYNGWFEDAAMQRRARTALALFNDAILRTAFAARVRVIELRHVRTDAEDYANPIEPSARGGARMAQVIARGVTEPTVTRCAAVYS